MKLGSEEYVGEIVSIGRRFVKALQRPEFEHGATLIAFLQSIPDGKSPYYESDEFLTADVEKAWRQVMNDIDSDNGYTGFMMAMAIRFAQYVFEHAEEPPSA